MLIDLLTSLLPTEKRKLWQLYRQFIRVGNKSFCFEENKKDIKKEKLRLLEKAIYRNCSTSSNLLARIKKEFKTEGLSVSLLTDWLVVWKYTSVLQTPLNEKRLSDIIGYAASPTARMIMALNNENPSVYLPFCSLISAILFLQLTHEKSPLLQGAKWSLKQRRSKLKGWLKNARVLLNVVSSKRLKFVLALLLNRLNIYEQAFQNNKQCKIGVLDEVKIFLYSIWQFIAVRHKSVAIKGM